MTQSEGFMSNSVLDVTGWKFKVSPLGCHCLIYQSCQFSSAILKFICLWFLLYCNSKLHSKVGTPFLS